MRLLLLACFACAILGPAYLTEIESDIDFQLLEENLRNKRAPDYGGGLGGPLAAGIREHQPDKDDENTTAKPYDPQSNINNTKKCEVVRLRKFDPNSKTFQQKASSEFDEYVKKYKKFYPDDTTKEKARQTFIQGKISSHELNRGRCSNTDAHFATTKYSDWDTQDFIQKLGGARADTDPQKLPPSYAVTENESRFLYKLPRWDWRTENVIPPVRDQQECGGCYAFSTTDLLASQERIDKKKFDANPIEPYSAQYFIDCMPEPYGYKCKGGRPAAVLEYMSTCSDCAILLDRCYQYRNRYVNCKRPSLNCINDVGAKPVFSKQVNVISRREAETMATLLRWGPVVTVVDLSPAWQYYNGSGIIREGHCGKTANHAVLIVGYDYTGDVPYYIVKNSWSDDWGNKGYVKVEAGKNTCGIASAALVTCTDKAKCSKFKDIHDFVNHPNAKPNLKPDGTLTK